MTVSLRRMIPWDTAPHEILQWPYDVGMRLKWIVSTNMPVSSEGVKLGPVLTGAPPQLPCTQAW